METIGKPASRFYSNSEVFGKVPESVVDITHQGFGDESRNGVAAATYGVVSQSSGQTDYTSPRLRGFPVSNSHCWLDSTVALLVRSEGDYQQFLQNKSQQFNTAEER